MGHEEPRGGAAEPCRAAGGARQSTPLLCTSGISVTSGTLGRTPTLLPSPSPRNHLPPLCHGFLMFHSWYFEGSIGNTWCEAFNIKRQKINSSHAAKIFWLV